MASAFTKIALNRFERLLRAGALSQGSIERVPGASAVAAAFKTMRGKQPSRHPVLTPALQKLRDKSLEAQAHTPRQDAIHQLSGQAKAKELAVKLTADERILDDAGGIYYPGLVGASSHVANDTAIRRAYLKTLRDWQRDGVLSVRDGLGAYAPITRPRVLANGRRLPAEGRAYARRLREPVELDGTGVKLRDGRAPLQRADRGIVVHEAGERELLADSLTGVRTAVPFDTHFGPEVLVREYVGSGGRSFNKHDVLNRSRRAVPDASYAEKKLLDIMRQVRPSVQGNFPVGGREERAVARLFARAVARDPRMGKERLLAFEHAARGGAIPRELEEVLLRRAPYYIGQLHR